MNRQLKYERNKRIIKTRNARRISHARLMHKVRDRANTRNVWQRARFSKAFLETVNPFDTSLMSPVYLLR